MRIDFVVPMVFDDDVMLQHDYRRLFGSPLPRNTRFRSWGTEELLIKCIRKYMPFVDTIFILLARESQEKIWMKQEGIKVVYHREFISERFLPCFNSCTIEMFLPYIDGLSEYFIYGNDDMYPLSPLEESDFFRNNRPCMHFVEKNWPTNPNIFHRKCMRQQEIVAKQTHYNCNGMWLHGGHSLAPLRKSLCKEARSCFNEEVLSGISACRSNTSYNHYLYTLWQYMYGITIDHAPAMRYTSTLDGLDKVLGCIAEPNVGILCINDSGGETDFKSFSSAVRQAIEKKLTNNK